MEKTLEQLRLKLAEQAVDLVTKAKIPPPVLATMLFDLAVALLVRLGYPTGEIAKSLHLHADILEQAADDKDQGDADPSAWN